MAKKYKFWYFMSRFVSKAIVLKKISKLKGGKVARSVEKAVKEKKEKKTNIKKLMKEQEKLMAEVTIDEVADNDVENVPTDDVITSDNNVGEEIVATEISEDSQDNSDPNESENAPQESKSEPMTEEKRSSILSGIMSKINIVNKPSDNNDN